MDITISLITTLVLTLINGYFSMSEMAPPRPSAPCWSTRPRKATSAPSVPLSWLPTPTSCSPPSRSPSRSWAFASSAVASTSLSDPLATWLMSFGIAPLSAIARGLAPVIITVAVAFVSIVIGELVPKRIGLANAEGVSKQVVGPLSFFQKIARPLVWLTGVCSDGLACILRIKSADDRQNVSEEEISTWSRSRTTCSTRKSVMIHEIFDLGDTVAREVMVPRVDTTMCEDDETIADVLSTMRQTGFSRIPVYHEGPRQRRGHRAHQGPDPARARWQGRPAHRRLLRDATFVPDTKDILPLLSEM